MKEHPVYFYLKCLFYFHKKKRYPTFLVCCCAGWVMNVLKVAKGVGRPPSMACKCTVGVCMCNGPAVAGIGTATIFWRGTPHGRYHDPGWCCILVWSIHFYSLLATSCNLVFVSWGTFGVFYYCHFHVRPPKAARISEKENNCYYDDYFPENLWVAVVGLIF